MVYLLRLVVLKTEQFWLNFFLKLSFCFINVSVCISQFVLICIFYPFSVVLQLLTKWNLHFGSKSLETNLNFILQKYWNPT